MHERTTHQMLFFPLSCSTSPLLHLPLVAACLRVSLLSVLYSIIEKHALFGGDHVTYLAIEEYSLIGLKKLLLLGLGHYLFSQ